MNEIDKKLLLSNKSMAYLDCDDPYKDDILGMFNRLPSYVQEGIHKMVVDEMMQEVEDKKEKKRIKHQASREWNKILVKRDKMRKKLELLREAKLLEQFKEVKDGENKIEAKIEE